MSLKILILWIILFSANSTSVFSQNLEWKNIEPIKSKLNNIELIFGKKGNKSHLATYNLDDGDYTIYYSYGPCQLSGEKDWNVPEWTVVQIFYSPNDPPKLSSLGIDLKKLKRGNNNYSHTPGVHKVTDEFNGITYAIQKDADLNYSVVTSINIIPGTKYKHLICKK